MINVLGQRIVFEVVPCLGCTPCAQGQGKHVQYLHGTVMAPSSNKCEEGQLLKQDLCLLFLQAHMEVYRVQHI